MTEHNASLPTLGYVGSVNFVLNWLYFDLILSSSDLV